MNNIILNLARKWRSKQFNQIIGQDLAVKLLKNSLFRNLIFPVYLFSGPKGSGKTSLARIFASSLNCEFLISFQNKPQDIKLPCLKCSSCLAMQKLAHPDFIEIDAASHTGVDNIRHIIETASFVPVMSKKKIYLIDEAHMLSKSAFNALLKILEEPPPSTVFILATTDEYKIIDTVKSRCFQVFFNSISFDIIATFLEFICTEEEIPFEKTGIDIIAREANGSVRDALNIVERVRLANASITKNAVFQALGFLDEEHILELFKYIINQDLKGLLLFSSMINFKQFNCQIIFKRIIELIRESLLIKISDQTLIIKNLQNNLKEKLDIITKSCSLEHLITLLDVCCSYELIFAKTNTPEIVLEMLLIKLTQKKNSDSNNTEIRVKGHATQPERARIPSTQKIEPQKPPLETRGLNVRQNPINNNLSQSEAEPWQDFLLQLEALNDPLVLSIFKQAKFEQTLDSPNRIRLTFNKDLEFFQEWIESTKNSWKPVIDKCFNCEVLITTVFDNSVQKISSNNQVKQSLPAEYSTKKSSIINFIAKKKVNNQSQAKQNGATEIRFDISDLSKWSRTNMLINIFTGSIVYKVSN